MDEKNVYAELSSIRALMERSSKFISISGLSGILAGLIALAGARMAFRILDNQSEVKDGVRYYNTDVILWPMITIAIIVLLLSVITSWWLTVRKAKKRNESVWNPVSRRLLAAISVPMLTGGLCILILLLKAEYAYIAALCLLFYGLALISGSQYTFNEIKWLGIGQLFLGLLALYFSDYGLLFWTVGFGLFHIIYGTIMHFKYER